MKNQIEAWRAVALDLGLEITAPCPLMLNSTQMLKATCIVKNFGAPNGMVIDPSWKFLEPHADLLIKKGFGFSAMKLDDKYDRSSMIEVLLDWGWTGPIDEKPEWLGSENLAPD